MPTRILSCPLHNLLRYDSQIRNQSNHAKYEDGRMRESQSTDIVPFAQRGLAVLTTIHFELDLMLVPSSANTKCYCRSHTPNITRPNTYRMVKKISLRGKRDRLLLLSIAHHHGRNVQPERWTAVRRLVPYLIVRSYCPWLACSGRLRSYRLY